MIVFVPMVSPLPVVMIVSGFTMPASSAADTANGLKVEPGSKVSVTLRLRICAICTWVRLLGLKSGWLTSANTSPVCASNITSAPLFALFASTAAFNSRWAIYCRRSSIDRLNGLPSRGTFRLSTSSTMRPLRSLITRRWPGEPASEACCASSIPSWP